jgi:hypothetical protein
MVGTWREYWMRMLRYLFYLPVGIGVAFIPFFLN